eukprot:5868058-Alexandrium_andersonii.AAC.1
MGPSRAVAAKALPGIANGRCKPTAVWAWLVGAFSDGGGQVGGPRWSARGKRVSGLIVRCGRSAKEH